MVSYLLRALWPDEIIERGVREHPELSVGSNTDGIDVRSVGNSQVLQVRTWTPKPFPIFAYLQRREQ